MIFLKKFISQQQDGLFMGEMKILWEERKLIETFVMTFFLPGV